MIDRVDQRLKEWMRSVLGGTNVFFDAPNAEINEPGIRVYLMELAHSLQSRNGKRPPLRLSLNYLITAWADTNAESHRMLGELVLAAMENNELEVVLDPLPVAIWTAFGVPPCPSFVLRVPLVYARPEPEASLVQEPLVINAYPLTSLDGAIRDAKGRPVMGAYVELTGLNLHTRTDVKGRFLFSAVPKTPISKHLRVKARGQEMNLNIDEITGEDGSIVIKLQEMEA